MNKIISVFTSIILFFQICIIPESFASGEGMVLFSEDFDSVITNAIPDSMTVKGSKNNRVAEESAGDKVLVLDLSAGIGSLSIPVSVKNDRLWLSARIKTNNILNKGNIFALKDSAGTKTTLISSSRSGTVIDFNREIGGVRPGIWQEFTAEVNFSSGSYSVYIDSKSVISDWKFSTKPAKSTSIDFEFVPTSENKADSKVWIDDIRVWSGEEWIKSFPSSAYNPESVRFEEKASDDSVKFYKQLDFDDGVIMGIGIELLNPSYNPELIQNVIDRDGRAFFGAQRMSGASGYHNIHVDNCDSYYIVFEFDFCVYQNETALSFFDLRMKDQRWNQDFILEGSNLNVKKAGTIPLGFGQWSNLAFLYNFVDHTFDVYHNRKLVFENVPMHNSSFENLIYARTTLAGTDIPISIGYDNFYVYEGETLLEDTVFEASKSLVSRFEADEGQVKDFLGESVAFSVTSGDAYNGTEKIDGVGEGIIERGRTLVPVRTVSEAFGVDVEWDGQNRQVNIGDFASLTVDNNNIIKGNETIIADVAPKIYNDRVYLPLRVLAEEVFGKAVHWDEERQMVIMQDDEVKVNTNDAVNMDMVYRYLMYERPDGYEMINSLESASRPRLFVGKERIEEIKHFIATNEKAKMWYELVEKQCEGYLAAEPLGFTVLSDGSLDMVQTREERMMRLCFMYKITGDEKYAQRAWEEMEVFSSYRHWGRQYLNVAGMLTAAATGYDWLYDWLSDEQKKTVADAMVKNGLMKAKKDFSGQFGTPTYIRNLDNWAIICNSGIMLACIAIADEGEEYREICADVYESAAMAFEYPLKSFAPDGGWREGPMYYLYMIKALQRLLSTLDNTLDTTYGYTKSPGFKHAGWYVIDVCGPNGYNPMGDSGAPAKGGKSSPSIHGAQACWWSDYFEEPELTSAYIVHKDAFDNCYEGLTELLCVNPEYMNSATSVPLDAKYDYIEYMAMRGNNWEEDSRNSIWASFHGGINNFGHGHADAGAFVFDALGERWATDIGSDSYSLPEWGVSNGKYYAVRGEGHNVCVINPDDGFDQLPSTEVAPITDYASLGERGSWAILDLTCVYSHQTTSAKRGFSMMDGRKSLTIRDEFSLKEANSEIYWFMHAPVDDIQTFDTYAILTSNGKQIRVDFKTNADSMEVISMKAEPLPTSPQYKGNYDYNEYTKKLALRVYGSGNVNITAKLTPLDGVNNDFEVSDISLSQWSKIYGK